MITANGCACPSAPAAPRSSTANSGLMRTGGCGLSRRPRPPEPHRSLSRCGTPARHACRCRRSPGRRWAPSRCGPPAPRRREPSRRSLVPLVGGLLALAGVLVARVEDVLRLAGVGDQAVLVAVDRALTL